MSNQIGLMLSFIFLSLLIVFSGELICYQQFAATFSADTGQIAHYLQLYGYDPQYVDYVQLDYDMNSVMVDYKKVYSQEIMELTTTKNYKSFSGFYQLFDSTLTCKMTIYR